MTDQLPPPDPLKPTKEQWANAMGEASLLDDLRDGEVRMICKAFAKALGIIDPYEDRT